MIIKVCSKFGLVLLAFFMFAGVLLAQSVNKINIPQTEKDYVDVALEPGLYDYYITAVYDKGESDPSNTFGGINFFAKPGAVGTPPGAHFDDLCFKEIFIEPCEDFDDLIVGGTVAEQLGGLWTTWVTGTPGDPEDAPVSDDYANSVPNSFVVNDVVIDLIRKLGANALTTGAWLYSHYMYVPSGFSGYFNVQSDPTPGIAWVIELYFDDDGTGSFIVNGVTTAFNYSQDTWFEIAINIDLDHDLGEVMFDGTVVHEFETPNTIGAIDYWGSPSGGAPGAYYDDVCFFEGYEILPSVLAPPENLTVMPYGWDIELDWDPPGKGQTGTLLCVDPDGSADLLGYNIYYQFNYGTFDLLDFTTETSYTHMFPGYYAHCYYVTAVYNNGESEATETECISLSGIEDNLLTQTQIYPNPATNLVTIKSDFIIQNIMVYNFAGEKIGKENVGKYSCTVNVDAFKPGIYLFRIEADEGVVVRRIVVK